MPQHESTEQTLHFLIPQSLHRRKFKIKLRRTQNRRVLACHQTQKISGNTALDWDVLLLLSILVQFVIRYSFSKSGITFLIHETGIKTIPLRQQPLAGLVLVLRLPKQVKLALIIISEESKHSRLDPMVYSCVKSKLCWRLFQLKSDPAYMEKVTVITVIGIFYKLCTSNLLYSLIVSVFLQQKRARARPFIMISLCEGNHLQCNVKFRFAFGFV